MATGSMPRSARIWADAIGMGDVGLAGGACLAVVRLDGEVERAIHPGEVGGGVVFGDGRLERRPQCLEVRAFLPGRAGTERRGPRRAGVLGLALAVVFGAGGADTLAAAACRAGADARSALVVDAADALDAVFPRAAMGRKDSSGSPFSRRSRIPDVQRRRDRRPPRRWRRRQIAASSRTGVAGRLEELLATRPSSQGRSPSGPMIDRS